MLTRDAFSFFDGPIAVSRLLGITKSAVYQWDEVVPFESATALEILSRGRLPVDKSLYPHVARALVIAAESNAA